MQLYLMVSHCSLINQEVYVQSRLEGDAVHVVREQRGAASEASHGRVNRRAHAAEDSLL